MLKWFKWAGGFVLSIMVILAFSFLKKPEDLKSFHVNGFAQGTTYHITYYAEDSVLTKAGADSIFNALDSSLSIYKSYSLISKFNGEKRGIIADEHLKRVVTKSLEVSEESKGIFDITILPLVKLWGFGPGKNAQQVPEVDHIKQVMKYVGYRKLSLKGDSLIKADPRLQIDVNGIAQGYSVDVIASFLDKKGINNYLVEVGGEIVVKGRKQPSGALMKIGIESPAEDEDAPEPTIIRSLFLKGGAVTTSGKYRNFYQSGNKKISHLIDPRTGQSLQNQTISVTVLAKDGITADAYDNVLMGMSIDDAFRFLKQKKELDAYFIYLKEDGTVSDTATTGFNALLSSKTPNN